MMQKATNEYSQAVFNLPWLAAQEEGLFAEEGIAVNFHAGSHYLWMCSWGLVSERATYESLVDNRLGV